MEVIFAGTSHEHTQTLTDGAGNTFDVVGITYRVLDEEGAVVVSTNTLSSFVALSPEATITIAASANALAADKPRGLRVVELSCLLQDGSTVVLRGHYAVRASEVLISGVNSFQSYAHAQLTALDVPNLQSWNSATEDEIIAAMLHAAEKIKKLRYEYCEEDDSQNVLRAPWGIPGDLELLGVEEFNVLPERFRRALRLAQVAEADAILTQPTELEAARDAGVVMDQIGDVKQQYRQTKPLTAPLSKLGMFYLGRYIKSGYRLARA